MHMVTFKLSNFVYVLYMCVHLGESCTVLHVLIFSRERKFRQYSLKSIHVIYVYWDNS